MNPGNFTMQKIQAVKPIPVRTPTPAELALKQALAQSKLVGHCRCIAHKVGIYPA